MKALILGAGGMGAKAAEIAARFDAVDHVTIADLNEDAARAAAQKCGGKASALQLDVTQECRFKARLADHDVVLNLVGPFFRFGPLVLSAALETGTPYLDICDDPEPTLDMLGLDGVARARNTLAIVGLGASPGISNLLAAKCCQPLDEIDQLITGWNTEGNGEPLVDPHATPPTVPGAATVHWLEQCSGTVKSWADGQMVETKPLSPLTLTYPGIGRRKLWTVGHPEPLTLPRVFPNIRTSSNVMVMGKLDRLAIRGLAHEIDQGNMTLEQAALEIEKAMFSERPAQSGGLIAKLLRLFDGPSFPPIFAFARGWTSGKAVTLAAHIDPATPQQMDSVTAIPLAIGLKLFAEGKLSGKGVKAPEAVIDPDLFFQELDRLMPGAGSKPVLRLMRD